MSSYLSLMYFWIPRKKRRPFTTLATTQLLLFSKTEQELETGQQNSYLSILIIAYSSILKLSLNFQIQEIFCSGLNLSSRIWKESMVLPSCCHMCQILTSVGDSLGRDGMR